ncbi:histidine kinase [Blautia pseudococcoides]|nr:histidine kinase [Blautia pseudococcoides]
MNDTAVKAVAAMSVFYRNSLSKGRFIIPLKQELELTEQYLYIQSLRYMEYVDYEFNLTATFPTEQIDIPKLTLQPIVENIFYMHFPLKNAT